MDSRTQAYHYSPPIALSAQNSQRNMAASQLGGQYRTLSNWSEDSWEQLVSLPFAFRICAITCFSKAAVLKSRRVRNLPSPSSKMIFCDARVLQEFPESNDESKKVGFRGRFADIQVLSLFQCPPGRRRETKALTYIEQRTENMVMVTQIFDPIFHFANPYCVLQLRHFHWASGPAPSL